MLKKLCSPAHAYLVISVISLVVMTLQNMNNSNRYCIGNYFCETENKISFFIMKIFYIIFWTWILNSLCDSGYPGVSWVVAMFPFIMMFLLIASFLIYGNMAYSTIT